MRRRVSRKPKHQNHEFELDLAPLLAVMVKLVPVLLVSSAFVQVMTIESDLPGSLAAAVEQSQKENITIRVVAGEKNKLTVSVESNQGADKTDLPALQTGEFDYSGLHNRLVVIKKSYPQIFHLLVSSNKTVPYQSIIKLMDEARKAKDPNQQFPYIDPSSNTEKSTNWMFPEVTLIPGEAT